MQAKRTNPTHTLLQGSPYTCAAATNVAQTWLRFGWTPPDRTAQDEKRNDLNPLRPATERGAA